jgi:hypothetical protein
MTWETRDESGWLLDQLNRDQVADTGGWPTDERPLIWRALDAIGVNLVALHLIAVILAAATIRSGGIGG